MPLPKYQKHAVCMSLLECEDCDRSPGEMLPVLYTRQN